MKGLVLKSCKLSLIRKCCWHSYWIVMLSARECRACIGERNAKKPSLHQAVTKERSKGLKKWWWSNLCQYVHYFACVCLVVPDKQFCLFVSINQWPWRYFSQTSKVPTVLKVCAVNCWLMELELTHFDEGDQRAMPEKLEVTASAPAYSDQRSAGTNSSSMVILTKEKWGAAESGTWWAGNTFKFSIPFCHINLVTPYVTVRSFFFFFLIGRVKKFPHSKTVRIKITCHLLGIFVFSWRKGYMQKILGQQVKAFSI